MHEMASSSPVAAVRRIPGVAVMLIVLVAVFAANSPGFLSTPNLRNVLVQSTVLLLLALPMTLIIMTEGLDLSMGAVLTLASLVVAIVTLATGSVLLGLLAACAVGTVFGIVNGWLVAGLGIPPFVATLGTLGMAQGLSLIVSDGQSIVGLPRAVRRHSSTAPARPGPSLAAGRRSSWPRRSRLRRSTSPVTPPKAPCASCAAIRRPRSAPELCSSRPRPPG